MALLRVPPLLGTHTDPATLHSCRASPPKVKLSVRRQPQVRSSGRQSVVASIKEVYKRANRKPEDSSSTSSKRHHPPWRTPWTPTRRRSSLRAPTRDWSNQQHYLRRPGERQTSESDDHAPNRTAMARILEKLRNLEKSLEPEVDTAQEKPVPAGLNAGIECVRAPLDILPSKTAGEIFLPRPNQDIFSIGNYWSTPDHPVPVPGRSLPNTNFSWDFDENSKAREEKRKRRLSIPTLAELIIPPTQLKKLRTIGIALEKPIVIGRLGITDNIANRIIGQWSKSELVKIKCGGPAAANMMKIHKDLERKTGGLVVWRSGSVAVVYRGDDYDNINKEATTLKDKLDGLLVSQKIPQRISGNSSHSPMDDSLPGLDSGGPVSSIAMSQDVPLRDDGVQNCSEKDTRQSVMPVNGFVQSTVPNRDYLEHSIDTKLDFLNCKTPHLQSDNSQMRLEITDDIQSDLSANNDLHTQLHITDTPRPIIYPDPFVDRDYELEVDSLLETLGPRCKGWTGPIPVPVDADLLPPLVPDFKPPYRLLPYGVRPQLINSEQTDLRRLVRHIAPHFVLGRNEGQQGLAAAILKLWEKSEVVKIAIKAGVQNTSNFKMAEELKRWTGGVLLSRDRFFITIYRGKNFLPRPIACAITERAAKLRKLKPGDEVVEGGVSTINCPSMEVPSSEEVRCKAEEDFFQQAESKKAKKLVLLKDMEEKLALALDKKHKAEKDLEVLETSFKPADEFDDTEPLTEEEKYMFRRVGLKLQQFLLIGRRGVFDGVVENMHLHWKHRELVKLIVKERDPVQLQKTAKLLESESGGVLIAVERVSKGQAIVVYRGKNYQCPKNLRPQNLPNKKKAYERSLELQRCASLTGRISGLQKEIDKLRSTLSFYESQKAAVLDVALDEFGNISSDLKEKGPPENNSDAVTTGLSEEEKLISSVCSSKKDLLNLAKLGPIFRATRLSNLERLKLRKVALKLGVGSRFHAGKNNGMVGLCRAIRVHFLKHALVVIGIKHRGQGTSAQDLVQEIEDLTGGVFVSQEENQIILYRGWPGGEKMPISENLQLSPELMAALEADEEDDDMPVSLPMMLTSSGVSDDGNISEAEINEDDDGPDYETFAVNQSIFSNNNEEEEEEEEEESLNLSAH